MRIATACVTLLFLASACSSLSLDASRSDDVLSADLRRNVLAIVLPNGRAVFALEPYREKALAQAKKLYDRAVAEAKALKPFDPVVVTFDKPEALYDAVRIQDTRMIGHSILAKRQVCGSLLHGSDTGCEGSDSGAYRTVYFDRYVCKAGTKYDECWNTYTEIGRFLNYRSKKDCEGGGTPTTTDSLYGYRCD